MHMKNELENHSQSDSSTEDLNRIFTDDVSERRGNQSKVSDKSKRIGGASIFALFLYPFQESTISVCLTTVMIQAIAYACATKHSIPERISVRIIQAGTPFELFISLKRPTIFDHVKTILNLTIMPLLITVTFFALNIVKAQRYSERLIVYRILMGFVCVKSVFWVVMPHGGPVLIFTLCILIKDLRNSRILQARNSLKDICSVLLFTFAAINILSFIFVKFLDTIKPYSIGTVLEAKGLEAYKQKVAAFCNNYSFPIENIIPIDFGLIDQMIPSALQVRYVFKSQSYILIARWLFESIEADTLVGLLKHEISHADNLDYVGCRAILQFLFPTIFFVTIINRARRDSPVLTRKKALLLVSKLVLASTLLGMCFSLVSNFVEYRADQNTLDTPESATGMAVALSRLIIKSPHNIIGRDYSVFSTHPPTFNRIRRISQRYPELFTISYEN